MKARPIFKGFTLIEILVVLLIVTILAGVTIARLPTFSRNADFETETRRLQLLFNMARQESILDSTEFGFRLTDDGYKFLKFDDGSQSWKDAESPFQVRLLPDELRLVIEADSKGFSFLGENLPPILILSSGENTPFRLILQSKLQRASRTLMSEGYGEFVWDEQ
ncbi:MAG: type II secretion system minor pseudopilin GspH [Gammaproteobacteria bacterium]|jgi:general secretion pathway protein H|nr:type II secretion system minor pseudopilin GspH [Gammaproteobacteria bacterium]MBT5685520.1 type II secretion system minor pseudopilin GspH [Gammaproteobacteria bacterium]MBT5724872.1 type II secretion system minor pseudopilin GspH [Gammaproteobacteria bacterium]MBT6892748.1 type II secretion system minor pseudopilin GspH [Gammaproteobacteria bacterium]MBT7879888.1 type II secretion system minor pseudopilin GspH [Gammaproteobacteria bacterium]